MSLQKNNKGKFISIRVNEPFRDLFKKNALESNYNKSSEYFRYIVTHFNKLREGYEMLNSLFIDLSNRAGDCISDFDVLREMIEKNIDIEALKELNRSLEIE